MSDVYLYSFKGKFRLFDIESFLLKTELPQLVEQVAEGTRVGLKVIVPNPGNITYIRPLIVKKILDFIKGLGALVELVDTLDIMDEGLEVMKRVNHVGYSFQTFDAPFLLADHITGTDYKEIIINGDYLPYVHLGTEFEEMGLLVFLTHFTGDPFYGYFGSITHMALRCIAKEFKNKVLADLVFEVDGSRCDKCGLCVEVCPVNAISINEDSGVKIDTSKCIHCGYCSLLCPNKALVLKNSSRRRLIGKFIDIAKTLKNIYGERLFYINVLLDVIPYPDYLPFVSRNISENIGIVASRDPVAVDKASLDIISQRIGGFEKFKSIHNVDPMEIILAAEKSKLGTTNYNLIEV